MAVVEKIACIGWGSLIWKPEGFPIVGEWYADGPALPIEFCRQSDDGSLSLVLIDHAIAVPAMWCYLSVSSLREAIDALSNREQTDTDRIGFISSQNSSGHNHGATIRAWMSTHEVSSVVWTALPPKFTGTEYLVPNEQEAAAYIRNLSGEAKTWAEEYVRSTPRQIATGYRAAIERELGIGGS